MMQEGVRPEHHRAVIEALRQLLRIAEMDSQININDFGVWRHSRHRRADGSLEPYYSADWYVRRGKDTALRPNQINGDVIINCLAIEPWQRAPDQHYDVVLLHEDLCTNDPNLNFVIGLAVQGLCTVLSTFRFGTLSMAEQVECIKTEVLHEMGHVFGLPSSDRPNLIDSIGAHCSNKCVMRQGVILPDDWVRMTQDRLAQNNPFCGDCLRDLANYFDF